MTTVDTYIKEIKTGQSFSLHNGLWGTATTVYHIALKYLEEGKILGKHETAKLSAGASGITLIEILGEAVVQSKSDSDKKKLKGIISEIAELNQYEIDVLEC